jgi:hypothetical protein
MVLVPLEPDDKMQDQSSEFKDKFRVKNIISIVFEDWSKM